MNSAKAGYFISVKSALQDDRSVELFSQLTEIIPQIDKRYISPLFLRKAYFLNSKQSLLSSNIFIIKSIIDEGKLCFVLPSFASFPRYMFVFHRDWNTFPNMPEN